MESKFSLEGVSYSSIHADLNSGEINEGTSYFHTPIPSGICGSVAVGANVSVVLVPKFPKNKKKVLAKNISRN